MPRGSVSLRDLLFCGGKKAFNLARSQTQSYCCIEDARFLSTQPQMGIVLGCSSWAKVERIRCALARLVEHGRVGHECLVASRQQAQDKNRGSGRSRLQMVYDCRQVHHCRVHGRHDDIIALHVCRMVHDGNKMAQLLRS